MFWFDLVLVLILIAFVVSGYKRGFILTAGQLVAAIVAFFVANYFAAWLGKLIAIFLPHYPGLSQFLAFLLIFFVVERLVGLLIRAINSILQIVTSLPIISTLDTLLGACLGLLVGLVFEGVAIFFITASRVDPRLIGWINHSTVAQYIQQTFQRFFGYFL